MGDRRSMEKVDMAEEIPKLTEADKYYLKKLEQLNIKRVQDIKIVRKKSRRTGIFIGIGVLSIYFYTMYAVRQERFLEDFNTVPEKKPPY